MMGYPEGGSKKKSRYRQRKPGWNGRGTVEKYAIGTADAFRGGAVVGVKFARPFPTTSLEGRPIEAGRLR